MKQRNATLWLAIVAVAVACLIAYLRTHQAGSKAPPVAIQKTNAAVASSQPQPAPSGQPVTNAVETGVGTNKVYQLRADQVLATVNGVEIKLGDLVPLTTTNGDAMVPLDAVTYNYLLNRAINRELMMQAAKAQGVGLTDAQQQQLMKLQAQRDAPEPGLLAKLNASTAAVQLELRDTEAFMLQTTMMAQHGFSPDVTPDQVDKYYQGHTAQFGDAPTDPLARKQWWSNVDIIIRELLEKQVRADYNNALNTFMDGQKAAAKITLAAPAP